MKSYLLTNTDTGNEIPAERTRRGATPGARRCVLSIIVMLAGASPLFAQSVQLTLSSSQAGAFVQQGDTIDWEISVEVSSGDNEGLAFLCADLIQSEANPATLDIPHADAVPNGMLTFSSPAGISNPPDVGMTTGYVGTRFGEPGAMNLLQIGGGQNIFGNALPASTGYAQNDTPVANVGQNGVVVVASGSFPAPSIDGVYRFELRNVLANVFTQANQPPHFSLTTEAAPDLAEASFTFIVGDYCDAHDANCDGQVNGEDVQPFMAAILTNGASSCSPCAGDTNADGAVTTADIAAFVDDLLAR